MRKALSLILVLALFAALILSGCAQNSPPASQNSDPVNNNTEDVKEIVIGAITEGTGTNASWGLPRAEALRIVEYQMQRDGGFEVNGQKYRFVFSYGENRGEATEAVSIAKRLLETEKVKFLFDGGNSTPSLPVCELLKDREVLSIGVSTIQQSYVGKGGYPYTFNAWKTDGGVNGIAAKIAPVIKEKLPEAKTVAFLFMNNSQTEMILPFYKDACEANGMQVVADERYPDGTVDFYSVLTEIQKEQPDILFIGNNDEECKSILKQAIELGFKNFASCRVSTYIPEESALPADGHFFGVVDRDFSDESERDNPGVQEYIADYATVIGGTPDYSLLNRAVAAYEPMYALAAAMQKAGSVDDVPAIAEALKGMAYDGKIWKIAFDENGQMSNDYYIYCYTNGQLEKTVVLPE